MGPDYYVPPQYVSLSSIVGGIVVVLLGVGTVGVGFGVFLGPIIFLRTVPRTDHFP